MLLVGTVLYGFCAGRFGRDSYEEKRVEGVGMDWVVARDERGEIHFAYGEMIHADLQEFTKEPKED